MDKDLLTSLKNDSRLAMEQIYHLYWEEVFDSAFKRIGDQDIAEDITQEIFISLWKNRNKLYLEGDLGPYLQGAVKYKVINHFSSNAIVDGHKAEFALLMNGEHSSAADTKIILKDLDREIEAAISLLPDKMRQVMYLRRNQERSVREIAAELGISVQTVKNQITAGMKLLRKSLLLIFLLCFLIG